MVHAMFMASEIGPASPARAHTIFMGCCGGRSMDHVHLASAAVTDRHIAKSCTPNSGEMTDVEEDRLAERWSDARGGSRRLATFAVGGVGSAQAAVVYCKTVGVPKGCVARPTPVSGQRWCTPVVGVARVGVGAPGVGVRPGTPMNRGGPVNRVGRR